MMYFEGRSCPVAAYDGRKLAKHESAVHMAVRLNRTGCPDHTVKNQRGLEHYYRPCVLTASVAYAGH